MPSNPELETQVEQEGLRQRFQQVGGALRTVLASKAGYKRAADQMIVQGARAGSEASKGVAFPFLLQQRSSIKDHKSVTAKFFCGFKTCRALLPDSVASGAAR